jgi:hypothetical protein
LFVIALRLLFHVFESTKVVKKNPTLISTGLHAPLLKNKALVMEIALTNIFHRCCTVLECSYVDTAVEGDGVFKFGGGSRPN